mmetsp:Transcript_16081/g.46316  ORF Transcript_16081/g.46316 Transcript_16081/m.46316 type:complete len:206 (-) Transcript_16081:402-1019(-)
MMASARTAAVRAGSALVCSSCRIGCSAPSERSASRNSGTEERLPSTAAAAPCTSADDAESSEMSERCHPAARKALASDASTPRFATHCTAACCTASSSCSSSSAILGSAPASRKASRFGSAPEREVTARATWTVASAPPAESIATRGWIAIRSMLQYRASAAKEATTRTIDTRASGLAAPPRVPSGRTVFAAARERVTWERVPRR